MAKQKCPECPKCPPGWIVQFGDLMSLLLVFFILLLSMSSMDTQKIKEAIGSLSGAMSVLEGGTKSEVSRERLLLATPIEKQTETDEVVNRTVEMIDEMNVVVKQQGGGDTVSIEESEQGFTIKIPASLLFKAGSATIDNDDAILFLKRIAIMIKKMPNHMHVICKGHTDNQKLPLSSTFKDNWDLSTARAISVVKVLMSENIKGRRLSASGHAGYNPIATNATPQGRAQNRRVELQFISKEHKRNKPTQKSILDKIDK